MSIIHRFDLKLGSRQTEVLDREEWCYGVSFVQVDNPRLSMDGDCYWLTREDTDRGPKKNSNICSEIVLFLGN